MKDIYLEIAKLVVMILAAVITRYLIPWIKAKTESETISLICDWAASAVLAAEQTHGAGTGAAKKEIVREFIQHILDQKGIELTDAEIDTIIEAAVKQMNMG